MARALLVLAIVPVLVGCQSTGDATTRQRSTGVERVTASDAVSASTMQTLAMLEGEWELVGADGTTGPGSVFEVTSAGSAVREIMFPGHDHEMTNLYHMDGDRIVCTHYCAGGNQPRMVAQGVEEAEGATVIDFRVDSVSNFRQSQAYYMGGLKLTIVDGDTVHQDWTTFDDKGQVSNVMTFVLKRKG